MEQVKEVIEKLAIKADWEVEKVKNNPDKPLFRIEEMKGYARGLWRAYYCFDEIKKKEKNK